MRVAFIVDRYAFFVWSHRFGISNLQKKKKKPKNTSGQKTWHLFCKYTDSLHGRLHDLIPKDIDT